jgi:hypothetical protein
VPNTLKVLTIVTPALRQMPLLDVKLMAKDQDLSFQRDPRPEQ